MELRTSNLEFSTRAAKVFACRGELAEARTDRVAIEEPLEIRIVHGPRRQREQTSIAVTMRTPGHDADLAAGFLFAEGLFTDIEDLEGLVPCGANVIRAELRPGVSPRLPTLERHVYTTSSCGVCGKASLEAVEAMCQAFAIGAGPRVSASVIHMLPARLREAQEAFASTGGLHACALFDEQGELQSVREDVGRHNAADKLLGAEFRADRLPLANRILLVSARASFELLQKAAAAGVSIFAAVGAPSSLAIDLATRFRMTLLGFVRDGRFNVYCGEERILPHAAERSSNRVNCE